jgi:hypothetical protein
MYNENAGKVSCSYDGEQVVVGPGSGIIEIRNREGDLKGRWQSQQEYYTVWSVGISRDGSRVVAILSDPLQEHSGKVLYLNGSGGLIWQKTLEGPFGSAGISDDGSVVAVTDRDRISFYNRSGNLTGTKVLEGMIWSMALPGDGSYAVAGVSLRDFSGNLYVIDNNGTVEWYSTTRHRLRTVSVSGNGDYLAGSDIGYLRFFQHNGTRAWNYNSSPEIVSIAISYRGEYVAVGSQFFLRYFNRSGTILWQYEDPVIPIRSGAYFSNVAMTDNGEYVVATTRDNRTLLFNNEGKRVKEFESGSWVSDMCLSGSGNALVIGSGQEIRYFDTGIQPLPDTRPLPETPQSQPGPTVVPVTSQKSPVPVLNILLCLIIVILIAARSGPGRR